MPDLSPAELLEIARFAWPDGHWESSEMGSLLNPIAGRTFSCRRWQDVHAAELAVIEEGFGAQYGVALSAALNIDLDRFRTHLDFAKLATAPIDARLRALLRVAREGKP